MASDHHSQRPELSDADRATLARFLADPRRPPNTLSYHALQGFLFAVCAAPQVVMPSEWMPAIFDDRDPGFADLEDTRVITQALMALHNEITAAINADQAALPADCAFRDPILDNFADDAPVSQWARGFTQGHQWLEESWDPMLPEELDEEMGVMLMALSFFCSHDLAEAFWKETGRPTSSVAELATAMRSGFADAMTTYEIGRAHV